MTADDGGGSPVAPGRFVRSGSNQVDPELVFDAMMRGEEVPAEVVAELRGTPGVGIVLDEDLST
jgi:hypothetical protein